MHTTTGSGKSTMLPPLLVAMNYRVLVTQPRRLPCKLIYQRVQNQYGDNIAGWEYSGEHYNIENPLLYITDGLFKEKILFNSDYLLNYDIIMLDEVHERGINLDLCISLLANYMQQDKYKHIKVILSSATLDDQVEKPFINKKLAIQNFNLKIPSNYKIIEREESQHSYIGVIKELLKIKKKNEQILCFLPGTKEIKDAVQHYKDMGFGKAYPIYSQINSQSQEQFIKEGTVFFSTNIAETSLTFPELKYVIDLGKNNQMMYDYDRDSAILEESYVSKSTAKQRKGRLGRTMEGVYIKLYQDAQLKDEYPKPEIERINLMHTEFSLWRAYQKQKNNLYQGLQNLDLPTKPNKKIIEYCHQKLKELGILKQNGNQLTEMGQQICQLPIIGNIQLLRALYEGLSRKQNCCGQDLIRLICILQCLNNDSLEILSSIPQKFISEYGDFMTLLITFNNIITLNRQEKLINNKTSYQQTINYCNKLDIKQGAYKAFHKALNLYNRTNFEFQNLIKNKQQDQWHIQSQKTLNKNDNAFYWRNISDCLLKGFFTNCFINQVLIHGESKQYTRLSINEDYQINSILFNMKKKELNYLLAYEFYFTPRLKYLATMTLHGEIQLDQLNFFEIQRKIEITQDESSFILNSIKNFYSLITGKHYINMKGQANLVIKQELEQQEQFKNNNNLQKIELRKQLQYNIDNYKSYQSNPPSNEQKNQINKNFTTLLKKNQIFRPMQWRYQNQNQITFNLNKKNECFELQKCRQYHAQHIEKEINKSMQLLCTCTSLDIENTEVYPRNIKYSYNDGKNESKYKEIEGRIAKITDSKRTQYDIWENTVGAAATRASRMEVVCWIACCKFKCTIEGGFVRDWVINKKQQNLQPPFRYTKDIQDIDIKDIQQFPEIEVLPKDLDIILPSDKYFELNRFLQQLQNNKIEVTKVIREPWRYSLLLDNDQPTGAFTIDLLEPHATAFFDKIDFDVNVLFLKKDHIKEIGMKVNIIDPPLNLSLEAVIDNIWNQQFYILSTQNNIIQKRITKMKNRGWKPRNEGQDTSFIFQPSTQGNSSYYPIDKNDPIYQQYDQLFSSQHLRITRIERVYNQIQNGVYLSMKKQIEKENKGNANERKLFHGTDPSGSVGIVENGFDDRYWNQNGYRGHGAYFADQELVSIGYAMEFNRDPNLQEFAFFQCKVLLGNMQECVSGAYVDAGQGFHSRTGMHPKHLNIYPHDFREYIIYRYGQAIPILKITFTK